MAVIKPYGRDAEGTHLVKKYSAPLRLWHWANAVIITGSLLTVLINSTIVNRQVAAGLAEHQLESRGITVNTGQAQVVAHALSDKVWDIHVYFGYCLAGLLLFRLLLEFFQLADQKFIRRIQKTWTHFKITKKNREGERHKLVVKGIYALFYIVLFIQVLTGLFLAFEDIMKPFKSIRHTVKDVHSFDMYLILAFIAAHLAGVFLAERKNEKGIVSDMINGGTDVL